MGLGVADSQKRQRIQVGKLKLIHSGEGNRLRLVAYLTGQMLMLSKEASAHRYFFADSLISVVLILIVPRDVDQGHKFSVEL